MSGHYSHDPEQRVSAIHALKVLGAEAGRAPEAVPALAALFGPDRYVNLCVWHALLRRSETRPRNAP